MEGLQRFTVQVFFLIGLNHVKRATRLGECIDLSADCALFRQRWLRYGLQQGHGCAGLYVECFFQHQHIDRIRCVALCGAGGGLYCGGVGNVHKRPFKKEWLIPVYRRRFCRLEFLLLPQSCARAACSGTRAFLQKCGLLHRFSLAHEAGVLIF